MLALRDDKDSICSGGRRGEVTGLARCNLDPQRRMNSGGGAGGGRAGGGGVREGHRAAAGEVTWKQVKSMATKGQELWTARAGQLARYYFVADIKGWVQIQQRSLNFASSVHPSSFVHQKPVTK